MAMIGMQALHGVPDAWPTGHLIRQRFEDAPISPDQLIDDLTEQLRASQRLDALPQGARVGVGAGSRGLTNLPRIVRAVVDGLRARGLEPVLMPAMGSHGSATPEGQRGVLAEYGITEASMGAPVEADVSTEVIGTDAQGHAVHFSSAALNSVDALIPINRIKLHTDFRGPVESGLCKM